MPIWARPLGALDEVGWGGMSWVVSSWVELSSSWDGWFGTDTGWIPRVWISITSWSNAFPPITRRGLTTPFGSIQLRTKMFCDVKMKDDLLRKNDCMGADNNADWYLSGRWSLTIIVFIVTMFSSWFCILRMVDASCSEKLGVGVCNASSTPSSSSKLLPNPWSMSPSSILATWRTKLSVASFNDGFLEHTQVQWMELSTSFFTDALTSISTGVQLTQSLHTIVDVFDVISVVSCDFSASRSTREGLLRRRHRGSVLLRTGCGRCRTADAASVSITASFRNMAVASLLPALIISAASRRCVIALVLITIVSSVASNAVPSCGSSASMASNASSPSRGRDNGWWRFPRRWRSISSWVSWEYKDFHGTNSPLEL